MSSAEVTPEELAQALRAVKESADREADWPYIDEFVIDGDLEPLVRWLCQHYRITPRGDTLAATWLS